MNGETFFGNENAERDDVLYECKINHPNFEKDNHLIITGRWGTGKTAQLFIINEELSKKLASINEDFSKIWYIQEGDLDIFDMSLALMNTDLRMFRKSLEEIWTAEILRRTTIVLGHLDTYYGHLAGYHWEVVRNLCYNQNISKTLWKQLPLVFPILRNDKPSNSTEEIPSDISKLFQNDLYTYIQKCLKDIKNDPIQPIIAIEPLETPNSDLDKQVKLAQEVIYSLINVFEKKFQPTKSQRIVVYIAIPSHRYKLDGINLPQKISQYKYNMHWDLGSLKSFINERIRYEFKKVGRYKFNKNDSWYDLIERQFTRTDHFETPIIEDTFDYALRFTHHRPRDLQKLIRLALYHASISTKKSKTDILKGIGGVKIKGSHLRDAVHEFRREATQLLIEEYDRGNPGFSRKVDKLKGSPACQTYEDFVNKLKNVGLGQSIDSDMASLWDAGLIGVEVFCDEKQQSFHTLIPEEVKKTDRNSAGTTITRGYFFEYNTDMCLSEILNKYQNGGTTKTSVNIVFHPKTYDTLVNQVTRRWPIGK